MSIHASPERAARGLDAILRRAGGVVASRDGAPVVVNYGSAAGELAACVMAAGIADCSALTKLELTGPPDTVPSVVRRVAGDSVAPGGALFAGGAWWCAVSPGRMLLLCASRTGERLTDVLHGCLPQHPGLRLLDRSADWAAIAVVGRRAGEVLAALGVYGPSGDPRRTAPLSLGSAGEATAMWLLESDHRAVAVVSREQAGVAWRAIEQAGQASGICCVGQDAAARYALLDRRTGTLAPV